MGRLYALPIQAFPTELHSECLLSFLVRKCQFGCNVIKTTICHNALMSKLDALHHDLMPVIPSTSNPVGDNKFNSCPIPLIILVFSTLHRSPASLSFAWLHYRVANDENMNLSASFMNKRVPNGGNPSTHALRPYKVVNKMMTLANQSDSRALMFSGAQDIKKLYTS